MKVEFCNLTGEVITPTDIRYDTLRQEWNRAIQRYPIAIVYCYNNCDVSNAIIWARCNTIPIRIRSGGHNYQGFSTGNAVLVIDISNLNYFKINEDMNYIKVGGGNYGKIVSMTFSLPTQKVDNVSLFTLYYPNASLTTQFDFFNTWQHWIVNAN